MFGRIIAHVFLEGGQDGKRERNKERLGWDDRNFGSFGGDYHDEAQPYIHPVWHNGIGDYEIRMFDKSKY